MQRATKSILLFVFILFASRADARGASFEEVLAPPPTPWTAETLPQPRRVALIVLGSYQQRVLQYTYFRNTVYGTGEGDRHQIGLRELLKEKLQFNEVRVLEGAKVTEQGFQAALDDLKRTCTGPDNLLYVHWIGHGTILDGSRQVLTYFSQLGNEDDAVPTNTLSCRRILAMLDKWKAGLDYGRERPSKVAAVFDICGSRHAGTPQWSQEEDTSTIVDLEAYSAGVGILAWPEVGDDGRAQYSAELIDSLLAQSRNAASSVELKVALDSAEARVTNQKPRSSGEPIRMYDPEGFQLAVRVIDVDRPSQLLEDARVECLEAGGGELRGGEVLFRGLRRPNSLGYVLRVEAPGYCPRDLKVAAFDSPDRDALLDGRRLVVPLVPEFKILTVSVTQARELEAHAQLLGLRSESSYAYDADATIVGSDTATFRIPRAADRVELLIDNRVDREWRRELTLADLRSSWIDLPGLGRVPRCEYTTPIVLGAATSVLRGRIEQDEGVRATIALRDHSETTTEVCGSREFTLDVPRKTGVVELIVSVAGDPVAEARVDLDDRAGATRLDDGRQEYRLDPIRVEHGGLLVEATFELDGADPGALSVRTILSDEAAATTDASLPRWTGDVRVGRASLRLPTYRGRFVLRIEGERIETLELPIDPSQARSGRRDSLDFAILDLGTHTLTSKETVRDAEDEEFWKLIDDCLKKIEGNPKNADKLRAQAKKIVKSRRDPRYAAVDLCVGLIEIREAEDKKVTARKFNYSSASKALEKAAEGPTDLCSPSGVPIVAIALCHLSWCEAWLNVLEASDAHLNRAKDAYERLKSSFPGAKLRSGEVAWRWLDSELRKIEEIRRKYR